MAEALVGGAFLSATLQVLFDRLASREVLSFFRRPNHDDRLLKKLELALLGVNAVLDDAEKQQITNPSVRKWVDELKDAIYDAEDLLDEIATLALRSKSERDYRSGPSQVRIGPSATCTDLFDPEIESRMEEVVDRLEYFFNKKDVLGLREAVVGRNWADRLPSSSVVDESGVFGRDDEKEKLVKLVLSDEASGNSVDVIPIVGMGGIGKTTLAQLVYNDGRVAGHFAFKVWVCVSDQFDILGITGTILEAIGSGKCETQDLNLLQVGVKERLRGKKFLIVLDDVWNEKYSDWDTLRAPFTVGAHGSKIIVTTRNVSVASIMQTVPFHRLLHLSNDDCWSLFVKSVFGKGDFGAYSHLEKVGKGILQKCQGLPLAVKTIAGMLRHNFEFEEWDSILKSDIWDLPMNKDDVLPALRLSYYYLPSHLKQCFAYCSIFPKDYKFKKGELTSLWIAQGFVQHPNSNKTLEKLGDDYFHELLSRSFFQQSSRKVLSGPFFQQSSGDQSSFEMHDFVHDLAQVVFGQFFFRLDCKKLENISTKVRHFSYVRGYRYDSGEKFHALKDARCLRTFLPVYPYNFYLVGLYLPKWLLYDMLPTLRCLWVLSLSDYAITELPSSIGDLMHLRYLDLSRTQIQQLPETICTLFNLETLLLSYCRFLTTLPAEIGKLVCLRHLDIQGTNLKEMPVQMSRLKSLQTLSNFVVGKCSGSSINELKELRDLRGKLCISSLQNVLSRIDASEARLNEKKHLQELVLEWGNTTDDSLNEREVLDNLQPHTNLMRLTIKNYGGTRFPNWLGDESFSNIVSMCLEKCDNCFSLPPLGQPPSLQHLKIAMMKVIDVVGPEFYGVVTSAKPFQSLETLRFEEMSEWEEWRMIGAGEFCRLRELSVIKCPKLKGSLPQDIPSLVKLQIEECPALMASLPKTSSTGGGELVLRGCDGVELGLECWSSLVKLEMSNMLNLKELTSEQRSLTNLQELRIIKCARLLSFPNAGQVPLLKRLSIGECPKLSFPLSVEMEHCHTSLETLSLFNTCCPSGSLPVGSFPKLQSLYISACGNLETLSIPPVHGLQSLEIINCENLETLRILNGRGLPNLASLSYVYVKSCPNMVSFCQGGLPAPDLTELYVGNCKRLKSLPEQMHIFLPSLSYLHIYNCPEIESFPEGGLSANLSALIISKCKKLVAARRKWDIFRLISLKTFAISDGNEESFPDEGLLPSTLTRLCIQDMPNLKSLNNRGFQLLSSLATLEISNCPQLKSFRDEALLPSTLTRLCIQAMPNLKSLNNWGFQLLSSLETLEISNCPQLKSLPKEGLPTSLSSLEIRDCPLLKARCQRDEGDDWKKIACIPFVMIDWEVIIL